MLFDSVLKILKDYERARRESDMHPGDREKFAALERAVEDIEFVWHQYTVGNLTEETYKVFDLFVNMWLWDKIVGAWSVTLRSWPTC